jgi:protein TonB
VKKWFRVVLAVVLAIVLNILGVLFLTAVSVSDEAQEDEEPKSDAIPAPEVRDMPEPRFSDRAPSRAAPAASQKTSMPPAPTQLPSFSTLDAPTKVSVSVDPALQADLDATFANLSRMPTGGTASGSGQEGLFESGGAGSGKADGQVDNAKQVSEVDEAPRIRSRTPPRYPLQAEREGITGYVVLRAIVERDGQVSRVEIVDANPPGVFEEAARRAFSTWTFSPGRDGGKPVRVWVRKRLEFRLR